MIIYYYHIFINVLVRGDRGSRGKEGGQKKKNLGGECPSANKVLALAAAYNVPRRLPAIFSFMGSYKRKKSRYDL